MSNIKVVQGQIKIASISLMYSSDTVKIFFVDCTSKYPVVSAAGVSLTLEKDEDTLAVNEMTNRPTEIDFGLPEEEWTTMVEASRYSVYAFLYHYSVLENMEILYSGED